MSQPFMTTAAALVAGMSATETAKYVNIGRCSVLRIAGELRRLTGYSVTALRERAKECPDEASLRAFIQAEIQANAKFAECGVQQ